MPETVAYYTLPLATTCTSHALLRCLPSFSQRNFIMQTPTDADGIILRSLWRVLAHDKLIICRQHFLDDAQAVYNPGLLLFFVTPRQRSQEDRKKKEKDGMSYVFHKSTIALTAKLDIRILKCDSTFGNSNVYQLEYWVHLFKKSYRKDNNNRNFSFWE